MNLLLLFGLAACNRADDVEPEPTPSPWDCGDGVLAAPDTGSFDTTDLPEGLHLIDLGVQTTVCGFSDPLTFDLPDGVTSATLVLLGHEGTVTVPGALTGPDGVDRIVLDPEVQAPLLTQLYGPLADLMTSDNPVMPRSHRTTVLLPNNDGVSLTSGTWTLEVGSWFQAVEGNQWVYEGLDSAVHAFVLYRDAPVTAGTLDIALHFTGSSGLTSAEAPSHTEVQGALDTLQEAFGPVGIDLGNVTYHDLPEGFDGPMPMAAGTCLPGEEIESLLASTVSPQPGALNVFFIEGFSCDVGGFDFGEALAGLSNGLPGLPFTGHDGVLVSTAWMEDAPELWAKVLAHEAGHYLGLFHTTELTGLHHDPLEDTPEGPSDNLMYFDASSDPDGFMLTPEQGRVLRQHPLVRSL